MSPALEARVPSGPLAGKWTLDDFAGKVAELDLFPAEPVRTVSRLYRRWAYESAALDLALPEHGEHDRGVGRRDGRDACAQA